MARDTSLTSNFRNKKYNHNVSRFIALLSTASIAVASLMLACLAPDPASAKTLEEYDADIENAQHIVNEKNAELEKTQSALDETVRWLYKNGNIASTTVCLFTGTDINKTISNAEYVTKMVNKYEQQKDECKQVADDATNALNELRDLRDAKANRIEMLSRANDIQFQQGAAPWNTLPYWDTTVGWAGCGLCAYTVIIDVLTGNNYTPTEMLDIRGDWRGMDGYVWDATGTPGSNHHDFTKSTFDIETYDCERTVDALKNELNDNERAALLCAAGNVFKDRNGTWRWSSGHFIAVYSHDEQGFHVSDSSYTHDLGANIIYSDADMQRLLGGTQKLVIYSN